MAKIPRSIRGRIVAAHVPSPRRVSIGTVQRPKAAPKPTFRGNVGVGGRRR